MPQFWGGLSGRGLGVEHNQIFNVKMKNPIYTGLFEMIVGVLTTCQFGTNSIIGLMFVESQRVHI